MAQKDYRNFEHEVTVVGVGYTCHNLTSLETEKGRRNNLALILAVALMPVVALFVQNIINVHTKTQEVEDTAAVRNDIMFCVQTGNAIHYLQIERGKTTFYVSSGFDEAVLTDLNGHRENTDTAVMKLSQWPTTESPAYFTSKERFMEEIKAFRAGVNNSTYLHQVMSFYVNGITAMIHWVARRVKHARGGSLWPVLVGYHMLMVAKENAGIERALGSTFFSRGYLEPEEINAYVKRKVLRETYMERSGEYDPNIERYMIDNFVNSTLDIDLNNMILRILRNNETSSSVELGNMWFTNMSNYMNMLKKAQDMVAIDIVDILTYQVGELQNGLVFSILLMVVAVLLTPFVVYCIKRLADRIQNYATTLRQKTLDLEIERKRSQTLLFELLPATVAQKMMNQQTVEPEMYHSVTIFFSDIVGFTSISSDSSPWQIVTMLNMLYKMFDDQLELYDVYKVETIGDAYMVASGLPQRNEERHCVAIADLAIDLLSIISHTSIPHIPDRKLQLRIGLNSGPVVAGVVGNKMPRYCVFGDTVNVASRMESSSLPGHIQISETTYAGLHEHGGFLTEERGRIEIKGKGIMSTYWLKGRTEAMSPNSRRSNSTPAIETSHPQLITSQYREIGVNLS